ncbi:hypothetical protein OC844_006175 [Tilletia horrida]|nr:hypothetical protein OC844_006175 [Tilletia horrida]
MDQPSQSHRVAVEHAFGMLKLRWQSMRSARFTLACRDLEALACVWIRVCVLLQNFLIEEKAEDIAFSLTAEERAEAITEFGPGFDYPLEGAGGAVAELALDDEEEEEKDMGYIEQEKELRARLQAFVQDWNAVLN